MARTRWLDDEEMRAWRGFIEVTGQLHIELEADLNAHGLTSGDYQVLVYLSEPDDGRLRMCDLADRLNLSPSGLTRRLDGLVRKGMVSRERSDADRRVMMAVLTPKGREKLVAAAPHHVASVRRHLIDRLDERQIRQLGQIFESLRRRD
jgi:DNA-binding MarR family transcriptional regulator